VTPGTCPFTIEHPIMTQRWEQLTFLHWSFSPDAVQRLLPRGLEVEPYDGLAWVGLVPFVMTVGDARGHTLPWASYFCETNVRTYVRDSEGRTGIWFFSLDAARLGAVVTARTTYRLPYFWSRMRLTTRGDEVDYACRRRIPGPRGLTSGVTVRVGEPIPPAAVTEFEHFLTARWLLFSAGGTRRRVARAEHAPWPLHRAEIVHCADNVVAAAGLPQPTGDPVAHYSPGVDVRIGRPERIS
jgi:uncharacterized protein